MSVYDLRRAGLWKRIRHTSGPASPGLADIGKPEEWIDGPLLEAFDGIVYRATVWFVLAALLAAGPMLLRLPPDIHGATHVVLPGMWAIYALARWALDRQRQDEASAAWIAGRERHPGLARIARLAEVLLPVGWMAAGGALLGHHLATTAGAAEAVGIDLPILAVAWGLAGLAWARGCRLAVTAGWQRRSERLRVYWARMSQQARNSADASPGPDSLPAGDRRHWPGWARGIKVGAKQRARALAPHLGRSRSMIRVLLAHPDPAVAGRMAAALAGEYDVDRCGGPHQVACPVVDDLPCPLVDRADVLVYDARLAGEGTGTRELIAHLRDVYADLPVVLTSVDPSQRWVEREGPQRVIPLEADPDPAILQEAIAAALEEQGMAV